MTRVPFELFGIECSPGWLQLIDPIIKKCQEENIPIFQIKEKFGGLRFYAGVGSQELQQMIDKAEEESYTICEECGKSGTRRSEGWIRTLCADCNEKRNCS